MMASAEASALLDDLFAYPEHASFWCPIRTRARLMHMLESGSDHVWRADGAAFWLSAGGHFLLYAARSPELFAKHLPEAAERLQPLAREDGAELMNVYATSAAARDALLVRGFELDDALQRLRHDTPQLLELDPRVRYVRDADIPHLAGIGQRAFPEEDWSLEFWAKPISGAETAWLVEADGDQPAGFLLASEMEEFTMITGLAVDPAFQGQGLGRALIRRVLSHAAAAGQKGVEVHANDRPQAVGAYTRNGFRVKHPAWALKRWL